MESLASRVFLPKYTFHEILDYLPSNQQALLLIVCKSFYNNLLKTPISLWNKLTINTMHNYESVMVPLIVWWIKYLPRIQHKPSYINIIFKIDIITNEYEVPEEEIILYEDLFKIMKQNTNNIKNISIGFWPRDELPYIKERIHSIICDYLNSFDDSNRVNNLKLCFIPKKNITFLQNFHYLKHITIIFETQTSYHLRYEEEPEFLHSINAQIQQYTFSTCVKGYKLINFIRRHQKTIKSIEISMPNKKLEQEFIDTVNSLDQLEEIHIIGSLLDASLHKFLKKSLILKSKAIKRMVIDNKSEDLSELIKLNFSNLEEFRYIRGPVLIPNNNKLDFLKAFIEKWGYKLKVLNIRTDICRITDDIFMCIIQRCINLEELVISTGSKFNELPIENINSSKPNCFMSLKKIKMRLKDSNVDGIRDKYPDLCIDE